MLSINPEIIFTILIGTVILVGIGSFLIVFLLQYQKRKLLHHHEVINLKDTFRTTLLRAELEIQELTLHQISQEIHDNIGQVLSLAKIYLATVVEGHDRGTMEKINDARQLVSKAIKDLRELSHRMNTDNINEIGLAKALEYEMELIKKTDKYRTDCSISGTPFRFEKETELILFRIVQESLTNILKHAEATRIELKILFNKHEFALTLSDNGMGFDFEQMSHSPSDNAGLGLRNIQQRAALISADLTIKSAPGKGTSTYIRINTKPEFQL